MEQILRVFGVGGIRWLRDRYKFWSLDPTLKYALTREEYGYMPHRMFITSGGGNSCRWDRLQNIGGTMSLAHATYVCELDWILRGEDQGTT